MTSKALDLRGVAGQKRYVENSASDGPAVMRKVIPQGVAHKVPDDLRALLVADDEVFAAWTSLTPLARNEWICWILSAKKAETRERKIVRIRSDLLDGKRRPCCWPGCKHRGEK